QLVGRIDWSAGRVESSTSYAENARGQAANDQLTADKADDPKKASDAEMNVPGENEQSLTDDEEAQTAAIGMIPGGSVDRNRQVNLSGKPRGILSAFVNSRTKRMTAADLLKAQTGIWPVGSVATAENIKDAIQEARSALRKALEAANVENAPRDPLSCVDRGADLAWELKMP